MVLGIIGAAAKIGAAAARNIAQNAFIRGIAKGMVMEQVIQAVVGGGAGYRRQEMIRDYHRLEGWAAQSPDIEKMYSDKPIPNVRHLYSRTLTSGRTFYDVELALVDPETGDEGGRGWRIFSDRKLSWNDIRESAVAGFQKLYGMEDFTITGASFQGGRLGTG